MHARYWICASAGVIAASLASAAVGQTTQTTVPTSSEPGAAPPDAPTDDRSGGVKEIIITAQKRAESAQRTPISVGVVTGQDIVRRAQSSLEQVLRDVPSVEVQGLAQGAQVYIRGVGSSIDPTFADPAVALMVDGAYNGRTEALAAGAYDIDRVEVLRGPQGTLYGRNASGGVVNVITASPRMDRLSGFARAQLGDYGERRLEGAVNVPFSGLLAVRLAGFREKHDGYVDDGSYDEDAWGLRGKILWTPVGWLHVLAKADIFRQNAHGVNTVPVPGSAGNLFFPPPFFVTNFDPTLPGPPFTGGVPILRFPNGWVQTDPGNPWSNNPEHVPGSIDRKSETYSAQFDADLGFATLTVLPAYTRSYNNLLSSFLFGSILPFVGPTYTINDNYGSGQTGVNYYTSLETRLTSNGAGPLRYTLGAYYFRNRQNAALATTTGFTNSGEPYSFNNDILPTSTIAAFGQVTYSVTDRFRVTGGLRISEDKNAQTYGVTVGSASTGTIDYNKKQSATQYKVGFEYDLAPRSLLYGHVATGFKQGGISTTIPPIPFEPEHLTAFEIGSKNRFLDNKVQLNLSAFRYSYRNYQFSSFQVLPVGDLDATANFPVVQNAGPTHINGAEAELDAAPWRNGHITASVTYLDATYGEAILPNNPFVNQGDFDLKGKQIQNAPEWAGNIGFEQGVPLAGGLLTFGVRTHLTTGYYTTPEQYLPGAYQKGYSRTDLSLRYSSPGERWSLGAYLKNVENEAQTTYVFPVYRRLISPPRTYGLTAGVKF